MEGTRVATVGIATFSASLFAAIWILMCVIGRLTRQTWMYFVGGVMLAIVVIIFVASPRKSGAGESADQVYTFYHLNIGIVGAIVFVTALAATCCVGCWESMTMRRAKVIVDRE